MIKCIIPQKKWDAKGPSATVCWDSSWLLQLFAETFPITVDGSELLLDSSGLINEDRVQPIAAVFTMLFKCNPIPDGTGIFLEEFPTFRTDLSKLSTRASPVLAVHKDDLQGIDWELLTVQLFLEVKTSNWGESNISKFVETAGALRQRLILARFVEAWLLVPNFVCAAEDSNWRQRLRVPRCCWPAS